jgi:adenylate cyclase
MGDRSARILVVDDTPQNIKLLEVLLTAQNYKVLTAASGEEALSVVAADEPDLVLLDIVMPGIDGYEVCRRLRSDAATRILPIVMVTASGGQEKVKALDVGADDFITKPFDKSELLARVGSLLRIKEYHDTVLAQQAELADWTRTLEERVQRQLDEIHRLESLRRFLPPQLAEMLISEGDESILESHRREITVVVCALRGFTAFSELAEPEEVMRILHEYHATVGQTIARFGGTLDRFAADEITVFFNDPLPYPDPARQAVRMAIEMRSHVDLLARSWRSLGHQLDFVAGIASGYATLGKIGFEGRIEYGAIGTVMSLAARLCDEASPGQILAGQRVKAVVEKEIDTESLGEVPLSGFIQPVAAYRLLGMRARGQQSPTVDHELNRLTQRELEVARLIARGYSNRDVAAQLTITEGTAANHVEHILNKLGFNSRLQVATWAIEYGLFEASPTD